MDLHLIELDAGSWVIVEIPGFTKANSGTPVDSLDALRKADATSYYKARDELWVKLVSPGDSGRGGHSGGVTLQVSR
jgi:cell migration-inducing and hyaluronan-binding protein